MYIYIILFRKKLERRQKSRVRQKSYVSAGLLFDVDWLVKSEITNICISLRIKIRTFTTDSVYCSLGLHRTGPVPVDKVFSRSFDREKRGENDYTSTGERTNSGVSTYYGKRQHRSLSSSVVVSVVFSFPKGSCKVNYHGGFVNGSCLSVLT